MPDYTIVAGPNGAGKSTFSVRMSEPDSLIFDADKVKASKLEQWPDIPIESIEMMITTEYWNIEDQAIEENKSLTVESNLRDDFLIKRLSFFKSKGYSTKLIFMLLPSVKASSERVTLRVAGKGHYVDLDSIKYNFEYSLKVLKEHFNKFDNVRLLDSSSKEKLTIPSLLLTIQKSKVTFINTNIPQWAKPTIDELLENITPN
jgi:predicted ABC-type ATPase